MSDWGKGAINNTIGWGQSSTNSIGYGSIYETSYAGDTALIGTSAAFLYSKSSFNQGEADPTPTITGTAGGSFNADAGVVFVDTGTYNSSTGQIDLSATSIGSHIITYTVNGVQSGQTVGVTAVPYASTSSFTFDGVNDYFDAGNNSSLEITGNFTLSAWVNLNTMTGYRRIIGKTNSGNSRANYGLGLFGGYQPGVIANATGTWFTNYSSTPLSTGVWNHLVGVYDGSNFILYVNGSLDNSTSVSGFNIATAAAATSGDNLLIGQIPAGTENFNGNIDEVSIWNTALSQSAVTEIYNSGAPNDLTTLTNASNTNLKAWYKF